MIFVTVGTHPEAFDRLVKAADELAFEIKEPVIIQQGITRYEPRIAEHFEWANSQRIEELYKEARVVVTHAAAGAIILAFRMQKPLVVVPRLRKYKEHQTDHQRQIAVALSNQRRVVLVEEPTSTTLRLAIEQAVAQNIPYIDSNQLVPALQKQLNLWCRDKEHSKILQERA